MHPPGNNCDIGKISSTPAQAAAEVQIFYIVYKIYFNAQVTLLIDNRVYTWRLYVCGMEISTKPSLSHSPLTTMFLSEQLEQRTLISITNYIYKQSIIYIKM